MNRRQIALLKVTPSFGLPPLEIETYRLYEEDGLFFLQRSTVQGLQRTRKTVQQEPQAVASWLRALGNASVPAMPVSPMVCDGAYLEIRIEGEHSTLTLGWWTIAPEGAQVLADFADWMRSSGSARTRRSPTMTARKYQCPACKKKSGVEILYGMPTAEAFEMERRNELFLGGCMAEIGDPDRKCMACGHEWMVKPQKTD